MRWNDFRYADGSIVLAEVYAEMYGAPSDEVFDYFREIESLYPIVSRQAAAIAIITAAAIYSEPDQS